MRPRRWITEKSGCTILHRMKTTECRLQVASEETKESKCDNIMSVCHVVVTVQE